MRSTQAPAGSAKKMNGKKPKTPISEKTSGVAWSSTAATIGIASCEICEPSSLIDWPVQSLRKSACAHSLPPGRRSLRIGCAPVDREGEAVRLALRVVGAAELVGELLEPT